MYLRRFLNNIPKSFLVNDSFKQYTTVNESLISILSKRNKNILQNSCRNISTTEWRTNYEGDGKTVATDLADDIGRFIIVESVNERGFRLSNKAFAFGSLILFPNIFLSWKVKRIEDINEESLAIFRVIEPKLDLLVLGIGSPGQYSGIQIRDLKAKIKAMGLNVEILPTTTAVPTYSFLLADFRVVAGAFLPLESELEKKFSQLEAKNTTKPKQIEQE